MTKVVLLEVISKPEGPGIEGGSGAYVHVFYQEDKSTWSQDVYEFVDYYGYKVIGVEEEPVEFVAGDTWSEENLQSAKDSEASGHPRFGTFHVFAE